MIVGRLVASDLSQVARIHCLSFPSSALTAVGEEAVRRYYEWQLEGPHDSVLLGCKSGEILVGFCVGGAFNGALSGFLRENVSFLIRNVLTRPKFLLHPFFRERMWMAVGLLWRFRRNGSQPSKPADQSFRVLSLAVDPAFQGSGAGRILMQECEDLARKRGYAEMTLTVASDNFRAIRFYEHGGWDKVIQDQSWHGKMRKLLA